MTFDRYTWKARIQPLPLVALPCALLAFAAGTQQAVLEHVGTTIVTFGVVTLIAGMARDRGRCIEAHLWTSWGGPPTTTLMLSNADGPSPRLEDHRRHLRRLLPDTEPLTDARDREEPDQTRGIIGRYTAHLRERTRDRSKFPIVADANSTYGFRRNCLGLRPIAIAVALTTASVGGVLDGLSITGVSHVGSPAGLTLASTVSLATAIGWWRAGPAWVRTAAKNNPKALLDAAEALDPQTSTQVQ